MSSPQRRPVSLSVITKTLKRSGILENTRSYSWGVRIRALRGGILGSSVPSHGLVRTTRSRTARLNTEWSMTWYLRAEVGDRPEASGRITFRDYVQIVWLPSRQVEVSTLAGYRSYLDKHFLPFFGDRPMAEILPSSVQDWVTAAVASGLSPTSVRKYHVMLHSVFKRAVRDRVVLTNPCEGTELPKIPPRKARILTPQEYDRLFSKIPDRFSVLVMTDIETGLRWGELIALRPRHIDFLRKTISVEQTIVEVSRKHSPTGQRMSVKNYPKDNEFRTLR